MVCRIRNFGGVGFLKHFCEKRKAFSSMMLKTVGFESGGLMMNSLLKVDNTTRDSMNPTDNSDVRFNQFRLLKKSFLT